MNTEMPNWQELARSFHEPARLSITSALCDAPEGLAFQELKTICKLTDGNLNRHIKVLHEAGCVQIRKRGRGRSSHTQVILSDLGRCEFLRYLEVLEGVLQHAKDAMQPVEEPLWGDAVPATP
jgi:DNA-binding transcriptional ArsR family regulator